MVEFTRRDFNSLSKKDTKSKFEGVGKVVTIKQTGGPTLMVINDGTSNFTFKAFLKPGVRAYPEVNLDDIVKVSAQVSEREGGIEGEVLDMKKVSPEESKEFSSKLDKIQDEIISPKHTEFSIKSDMMESQKGRFIKIAKIIRKAIIDGRPIIMRHNADCDGYSSAITMERAILAFMKEVTNGDKMAPYQNYKRCPSKAPFYEYEDSVKDLSNWLRDKVKNGAKEPLIIITDNGSTDEDILAMKQMLLYNAQMVVIDHHFPGEIRKESSGKEVVEVDKYIDEHINPYLTGFDSNVCCGMLGYELANFIYKDNKNSVLIPAMAAILDHTECPERDAYIERAKAEGFDEEYLQTLGEIIDMQSHYIRFNESREFIDDLFGNNMEAQKKIVEMLGPELDRRYEAVWKVGEHYSEVEDFGPFYLVHFNGERGTYRGEYPAIGKSTNHIHRKFEEKMDKPVITMTSGSTFITIRISDDVKEVSVPEFAKSVVVKMPYTNADGGGHERAGSVKFVEYAYNDVINLLKDYFREVAKRQ